MPMPLSLTGSRASLALDAATLKLDAARRRGVLGGIAQQVDQHLAERAAGRRRAAPARPAGRPSGGGRRRAAAAAMASSAVSITLGERPLGRRCSSSRPSRQARDVEQVVEQQLHGARLALHASRRRARRPLVQRWAAGQQLGGAGDRAPAGCAARATARPGSGPWRRRPPPARRAPAPCAASARSSSAWLRSQRLRAPARACGLVAQDLDEADGAAPAVVHPHQGAVGPEARAVLALVHAGRRPRGPLPGRSRPRAPARLAARSSAVKMMSARLADGSRPRCSPAGARRRCSSW